MDLAILTPRELPIAARALKGIAAAGGAPSPADDQLLALIGELHGTALDVAALDPVSPAAVADVIVDPHHRKRLVQLALVTAMASGEVTPEKEAAVRALAAALHIPEPGIDVLHDLAEGSRLFVRLDLLRRLMPRFVSAAYDEEGLAGVRKMFTMVILDEDRDLARRYHRLGLLPEGTFGRVFWEHMTTRGFGFPGERGGFPERMVFHDFGHVLAGYDTDPEGEIQQGAFQAGFMRNDGFAFLLFVIVHFHLGVQITPIAKPQTGLFDVRRVLGAVARGAACNVDLSDHWSPWDVVHLPIEAVRARYGIS